VPGTATLGSSLIDDLVTTVDELRGELNADLGTRQYRVFTVRRTWDGGERGAGDFTEVETEITPQPLVEAFRRADRLEPSGLDEADVVKVSEVSLTYTEAELAGAGLTGSQEWVIRLKDAHGQGIRTRDFVLEGSPWPDRVKTLGWMMNLRRASDAEAV
jgi:hypothetical protein